MSSDKISENVVAGPGFYETGVAWGPSVVNTIATAVDQGSAAFPPALRLEMRLGSKNDRVEFSFDNPTEALGIAALDLVTSYFHSIFGETEVA